MSSLSELSSAAQRSVVESSPYTALLKFSNCNTVRTSRGNTKHSVVSMRKVIFDYLNQTKNLATALKRSTLKQTVDEVYKYVYSHYQYKADGELQQLRSPECSFAERFNGIDCKNYSILASSILLNLGIRNIIRRVKQPDFNSELWTHVYIVVPKDQRNLDLNKGYFVIDGTLHTNREVKYIKKQDTIMNLPHAVLNAGVQQGRSSTRLKSTDLNYFNAQKGFSQFLQFLVTQGIASGETAKYISIKMQGYLNQGIDPEVSYNEDGIFIHDEIIYYNGKILSSNIGLGLDPLSLST